LNQRLGVLKHEMMHILYNHLDRFPSQEKDTRTEIKKILKDRPWLQDTIKKRKFKDLKELYYYLT